MYVTTTFTKSVELIGYNDSWNSFPEVWIGEQFTI